MESLLDSHHGATSLLAGLIILLCLHLLMQVGRFLFEILKKKNESYERQIEGLLSALKSNSDTFQKFEHRIAAIERDLNEVLKFKVDFRRLFSAVKFIAGDKWPEAKKAMKDFDLD